MQNNILKPVKLLCVLKARNEEKFLPGLFASLREFVPGFVVLDDGSTDRTPHIINEEEKVISVITNPPQPEDQIYGGSEKKLNVQLLTAAQKLGANVVFCPDPDERYEVNFLRNLDSLARKAVAYNLCMGLKLRELWDRPDIFRHDGIWGKKMKYILFPVHKNMTFDYSMRKKFHIPWYHDELMHRLLPIKYTAYHLKMIYCNEREARKNLYEKHDPNHECQALGYQYLTDIDGIRLARINPTQAYDYKTLPNSYYALLNEQ